MPLHAQIVCIGGNAIVGLFLLIAAAQGMSAGDPGLALFLALLAAACGYTIWVLLKFKHYLSEEATREREARLARIAAEPPASPQALAPDNQDMP